VTRAAPARAMLAGLLAGLAGCAAPTFPPPQQSAYTVAQLTRDSMAYRSALPRDAPDRRVLTPVHGEACASAIFFPPSPPDPFFGSNLVEPYIPWPSFSAVFGDDGYARAVAQAMRDMPDARLIDVRADVRTTSVLGIWVRGCVVVHGMAAR